MYRIGIYGASGYAGLELAALVADQGSLELGFATSDRFAGKTLEELGGITGPVGRTKLIAPGDARADGCAAVLLATPPEASRELVPRLAGTRVIDLSNAYRLDPAAVYGLPELQRDAIAAAPLVANPGCYATAATLALAPLLAAGAIAPDVVVDAMSGVTGAGRKSDEAYSFVEIQGDARTYRTLTHQHEPEIAAVLARYAKQPVELVFTPHLVPIARGILSTAYATLARDVDPAEILRHAYRGERFVRVVASPDDVSIAKVAGTNDCLIGAAVRGKRVVVVSAIDNLIKGAAGQAIQNLNLMLGCEEATGLHHARRRRP